ncbi:hypothetical protein [Lelliottia sp. CFBP8978]|uniref:hypothetical protein n=1 Tax=Lelliottia sp. CFBP8978 TaxID=3096522 RepID=UPI002A6AF513|nr:hypothetical protein [Lelliottia sp. CFBP8978]MDY1038637.1 hypothetical protein [Lelliottia sp. CFBP8978]
MPDFKVDKVGQDVLKVVLATLGQTAEIHTKAIACQTHQYVDAYAFLIAHWDEFEPDTRRVHQQEIQDSLANILKGYAGVSEMAGRQAVNAAFNVIVQAAGEFIRLL